MDTFVLFQRQCRCAVDHGVTLIVSIVFVQRNSNFHGWNVAFAIGHKFYGPHLVRRQNKCPKLSYYKGYYFSCYPYFMGRFVPIAPLVAMPYSVVSHPIKSARIHVPRRVSGRRQIKKSTDLCYKQKLKNVGGKMGFRGSVSKSVSGNTTRTYVSSYYHSSISHLFVRTSGV